MLPPSRAAASATVTSGQALGLSTVYRAVSIRTTAARQLSIDVHRGGTIIDSPAIIRRPDVDSSLPVFIERTVVSLNLTGNAFWRIRRNSIGQVVTLEALNPHDVQIDVTASGRVTGYGYQGQALGVEDVKHLARLRVPGTPYGLGPIQAAQAELRGAIDLRDYAANWIASGDVPSGILRSDQQLTPEQATDVRTRWETTRGGKRGVAVLGSGMSYTPIFLSPADAQFIESQNFTTTQIARLFGVPASLMLASTEGAPTTYQNVAQDWLGFVRFGLMEDLSEIEDALTDLLPRGQFARFNLEVLLRSDTTTRYATYKVALEAGFMTVAEVRAIENLPPLAGAPTADPQGAAAA
ncbi:phage portal protein [Pseudolysinimonas kribbensis]|uniref:phage portal protein n=1 Tax=Pseudolysinimonas kribbensis TaxID=433641 RepID=UPI0031D5A72C